MDVLVIKAFQSSQKPTKLFVRLVLAAVNSKQNRRMLGPFHHSAEVPVTL
jgi:hypothetical protein